MGDDDQIDLVYDPQCPVCEFYCQRIDVSESSGKLSRIDARKDSPIMNEITTAGLDIDQGMVVKVGTELYYGSEAIHQLALLSSRRASSIGWRIGYFGIDAQRIFSIRFWRPAAICC